MSDEPSEVNLQPITIAEYDAEDGLVEMEKPLHYIHVMIRARGDKVWKIFECRRPVARTVVDEYGIKHVKIEPCGARFLTLSDAKNHVEAHEEGLI